MAHPHRCTVRNTDRMPGRILYGAEIPVPGLLFGRGVYIFSRQNHAVPVSLSRALRRASYKGGRAETNRTAALFEVSCGQRTIPWLGRREIAPVRKHLFLMCKRDARELVNTYRFKEYVNKGIESEKNRPPRPCWARKTSLLLYQLEHTDGGGNSGEKAYRQAGKMAVQ